MRRLHAALAASALALALGGCAAVAIPVVAGSAVLGKETLGDGEDDDASEAAPDRVEAEEPAEVATEGAPYAAPPPSTLPAGAYTDFFAHASEQAALDPVAEPRGSAILAAPGSLQPETVECAIRPPAVLVDLDPAGGTRDFATLAPDPALAQGLQELRLEGLFVYWISEASAAQAGTLRKRLTETGLDPTTDDGLLLMRRAEDRKQLRREELSKTHCVVAILGDERSDFDELFDYLKNPAAASALDALIGNGWFLVPTLQDSKEG